MQRTGNGITTLAIGASGTSFYTPADLILRKAARARARTRAFTTAWVAALVVGSVLAAPGLVVAQTAEDPSNVVLVFDVSNSILLAEDGVNVEFADALDDIADRVQESAAELAVGNAEISFVVFGRRAIPYPNNCDRLALNDNPAAVERLEECLRAIAAEYRAGEDAPVRQRVNTVDTDHVAALVEAADLLPDRTVRSAVIFFTDGQHDPPGTNRDDENVVARIANAYQGRSPLAILPVGLGTAAGEFEDELTGIYDAYFRDMEPCEGRTSFAWPEVVFEDAEDAGIAVAQALQEVTCSFTFVPEPTATPTPQPTPTIAPEPGTPIGVQLLAGNESITVQWLTPADGGDRITDYLVRCRPEGGGDADWIESSEGVSTEPEAVVEGLTPGVSYVCEVAATDGVTQGAFVAAAAPAVVLGAPGTPGQPEAEVGNSSALLRVGAPPDGGAVEQYIVQCTDAAGGRVDASGTTREVVVTGLVNGSSYTCIAFAENAIGRSAASPASRPFGPCGGLFECQPWTQFAVVGGLVAVAIIGTYVAVRRWRSRNRVWITAQLDGGENKPLGWGPEMGLRLSRDAEDGGWQASTEPFDGSRIRVRYTGSARFMVNGGAGIQSVHQGDPAPIRDDEGGIHQLILRRYRRRPRERVATAARPADPAQHPESAELTARIRGRDGAPGEGSVGGPTDGRPEGRPEG